MILWPPKKAQRAIFFVQRELERLVDDEKQSAIVLCDRGTLDGLAYWPDDEALFWKELGTSKAEQFSRYAAVIHLRTPPLEQGYNHQNPVRIESAIQAAEIDQKIANAWNGHPRRFSLKAIVNFWKRSPDYCPDQRRTSRNAVKATAFWS
ncbi:MAG: AAA family ATPase [Bdellovibrionales bacterium]|nr:AAA family ATPase [Bdellovibrionales bacterium]